VTLAIASGLLLALSFPRFGLPALAWIALSPLLVAVHGVPVRRAFTLGLISGLTYFTGTLYWITRVMAVYGGLNAAVAGMVNALLIAYLALFPALFAVIVSRLCASFGVRALLAAPLAWVATELGRAYLFTGFPWVLLGYSQASVLPVAQFAAVVGVFGLSGLLALVGSAVAYAGVVSVRRVASGERPLPHRTRGTVMTAYRPLVVSLVLVGVIGAWGSYRIRRADLTRRGDRVEVGLIQANVDQGEKWDRARAAGIFQQYLDMTQRAIGEGAQVVIWPESSSPFYFEEDRAGADQVRAIARASQVPIVVGSDQILRGVPTRYYNSAFLVAPDGSTAGVYRKMHLVPFGEYVPLKRLLFFVGPLVEAVSDFSAGEDAVLLPVRGHLMSTSICYEIVYPDLVRAFTRGGSELLTTITNDAWFGNTSAPYQHFAQASMRAIENGRYLVRSANTGISGIVDPYGRVRAETAIFERAIVVGEARFLDDRTIYVRIGDVFAYAGTVITLLLLVAARRRVK
jgi:apolipoprotein N-acyltransferase